MPCNGDRTAIPGVEEISIFDIDVVSVWSGFKDVWNVVTSPTVQNTMIGISGMMLLSLS